MRLIISFIIIIFAISILVNLGQLLGGEFKIENPFQKEEKKISSESAGLASIVSSLTPSSFIDTYITAGPKEGETIEETDTVTFEFEAEAQEGASFETKIEGVDSDWQKTDSSKRTITLPPEKTEYTFLARTVTSNSVDPTPAKRTFKVEPSPYLGKVKITSVSAPNSSYPSVISLRANINEGEEINLTGWQIEGKRGKTTIPQGIEKYFPDLSPKDNIIMKRGDTVYLSNGQGPLGKKISFRPNKCLGYLVNESYRSSLSLSKSCPRPTREEVSHLSPCCQEFVLRGGKCEAPDYSWNYKIYQDSECTSYIERYFSYSGCFRNYIGDEDFLSKSWYVFLSFEIATGDFCDTIYLRDQNGLFVDKYSYGRDVCR